MLLRAAEHARGTAYALHSRPDALRTALALSKAGHKLRHAGPGASVSFEEAELQLLLEAVRFANDEVHWAARQRETDTDPRRTAIALRKQTAELVDDVIGVEADGFGVVAHERAREETAGPLGEVVGFEPDPELDADVGLCRDGFERDTAAFAFTPQPGSEGVAFRHSGTLISAIPAPRISPMISGACPFPDSREPTFL